MNNLISEVKKMSSREIAELTGKEHKHVLEDIRKMLESLGIDSAGFSAQYKDSTGRDLPCFNLPKRETLILVSGYNIKFRAAIIDRWEQLEGEMQRGISTLTEEKKCAFEMEMSLADVAARMLRVSETSKIRMLETAAKNHNVKTDLLPNYSQESLTKSVTELLKDHGINLSAVKFNKILLSYNVLEELTRPSAAGRTKKFKSITKEFARFGKNETSPHSPRQTQPMFYINKFNDLLEALDVN